MTKQNFPNASYENLGPEIKKKKKLQRCHNQLAYVLHAKPDRLCYDL